MNVFSISIKHEKNVRIKVHAKQNMNGKLQDKTV